jgi:energy-coupling factor transporter ATP-binding protein EcfA2
MKASAAVSVHGAPAQFDRPAVPAPALEVRKLTYRYPEGRIALEDLSFTVAPGECLAVLGPNGAGKSTLLLHLNGLLPEHLPPDPAIWSAGEPLTTKSLETIRQRVGLLFQDPDDQLISATVFEDVAFGPRQLGLDGLGLRVLVERCLKMVGLQGFEQRQPFRLSHGEKRRVCLAGVLACQPNVLVLDEPTSDLDPRGRREFKTLLRGLPGAKIIATHDLELAVDLCSRVLVLDAGKLVAEGPTVALLSNEELMLAHGLEKPHSLLHRHPHN